MTNHQILILYNIVQKSGFLDLIEPYDLVMADRGFTIREELLFRMASLSIPPASAGLTQMSAENVLKTKRIANARIHVERAINRIKWYKLLYQLQWFHCSMTF